MNKTNKLNIMGIMALVAMILPLTSFGQDWKVLERSSKKTPEWLLTQPQNTIVAEVEAPSMSEARDMAVEELSRRVIMSVATNVFHTSSSSASHVEENGKLDEKETFGYDTKLVSARIPFIKGIALSQAKDTYWEKCKEKKTNRIFYRFAVLYPLSSSELAKMRQEFEKTDSEKSARLQELKSGLNNVTSAAQIEQAVAGLEELKEYFFDNVRRAEAEGLQSNYRKLYKGLTLQADTPENGEFEVTLLLNGRPFEANGLPTLKSNCAARLQAEPLPDGTGFRITYDSIDCLPEEDNWVEVNLRLRDTRLNKKVYI